MVGRSRYKQQRIDLAHSGGSAGGPRPLGKAAERRVAALGPRGLTVDTIVSKPVPRGYREGVEAREPGDDLTEECKVQVGIEDAHLLGITGLILIMETPQVALGVARGFVFEIGEAELGRVREGVDLGQEVVGSVLGPDFGSEVLEGKRLEVHDLGVVGEAVHVLRYDWVRSQMAQHLEIILV